MHNLITHADHDEIRVAALAVPLRQRRLRCGAVDEPNTSDQ